MSCRKTGEPAVSSRGDPEPTTGAHHEEGRQEAAPTSSNARFGKETDRDRMSARTGLRGDTNEIDVPSPGQEFPEEHAVIRAEEESDVKPLNGRSPLRRHDLPHPEKRHFAVARHTAPSHPQRPPGGATTWAAPSERPRTPGADAHRPTPQPSHVAGKETGPTTGAGPVRELRRKTEIRS